ncbi:uncharacterized protein ACLA_054990 [Aspergillus clavatus NRRL 1]|uniref:Uncharacterized protein n=1 Tax=Aspergillus clavatus (strain ATCC 1007 / CBS 513.65 / DSM 816 / NCTC 3887 / NRRL 1 / QM 1276 / 107) TaxID=344612 RepID=A1C9C8_ASPCL|nr:uncharacterized protein ACLA_054990 [Aspergillus clavatus NRRL 1]EAW13452.1 hypothetical protein ACLA_054990 [Aspergillus clavatus NRRL 1]
MPMELAMKLLSSEAATLRYLKSHSDIPVPEVYDYCASSNNDIGVPYILMSKAPGWPLSKVWGSVSSSQQDQDHPSKAKVLTRLGSITWKLSQLRLENIGSLFENEGSIEIKESLWRAHMLHGRYALEVARGPFPSKADFYNSLLSAFKEHAETLQLSHHCFVAPVPSPEDYPSSVQYRSAVSLWSDFVTIGHKIDSSDNRLDYIIAGDALREIVQNFELPGANAETFPLCHADLSVNNIYVDDDYNITCIIDWAFASSIPESLLLAPPGLPQYRDELSPELHPSFIEGFIDSLPASIDENSVHRYRELVQRGQVSWRLSQLLNLDSINDYDLFASVWPFARGPGEDVREYFLNQRRSPHYTKLYEEIQEEDQPLSTIEKDERDYFQTQGLRKAIAKKLTFISKWKQQHPANNPSKIRKDMFVATPQLWK